MLPFLKKKVSAQPMVTVRKSDQPSENIHDSAKEAAASELIQAISSGDAKAVASAFEAMFQILESAPHDEVEHAEA